ncbi:MAG: heavy-metal-associated domain-containing protein [Propionibacteriaceae bacterium]|nr:heavy-metal-associated domain-containing protein [Propionibacteriaceae bacterium]
MVDLTIKDANAAASGGGCGCGGCGCGGGAQEAPTQETASQQPQAKAGCSCGPDCDCGCQDGKPCTCGDAPAASDDEAPAGAVVAEYTVSGMTCGHCVNAITEEVEAIPGVTAVKVDLDSGSLKVGSEAPVDFDRIVEAVAEAGDYTVS